MMNFLTNKLMAWLSRYSLEREQVLGVDITPDFIRIAQLSHARKKWSLTHLSHEKIEGRELDASIQDARALYVERLRSAIASAHVTTTNVALSIPVSSAIVQVVSLPLMSDEELQGAIETGSLWENAVQLAEQHDDYSISWQTIRRDADENKMELLFVASKMADVNLYADIVREAGLTPVILNVRCFALKNALELQANKREPGRSTAFVEVGPHENYVMVLQDRAAFISGVFVSDADKHALADPDLTDERCQHVTERLAMQIRQTLSAYQSKFEVDPIVEVQLITTAPNFNVVKKGLARSLQGFGVHLFDPVLNLNVPPHLRDEVTAEVNPSVFAASIGLASRKLDVFNHAQHAGGTAVRCINLLPGWEQERSTQRRNILIKLVGAFVLVLGILGFAYATYVQRQSIAALEERVQEYGQLSERKDELTKKISELNKQRKQFGGLLEASSDLRSNSSEMYQLLLDITKKIPQGVWLESVIYRGGQEIQVLGKSVSDQNILQFISKLNSSELISRASLNTMTLAVQSGREVKKFNLTASLKEKTLDSHRNQKVSP